MPKINPRIKSIDDTSRDLDAAEKDLLNPPFRILADQNTIITFPAGHSCFPRPSVPAV